MKNPLRILHKWLKRGFEEKEVYPMYLELGDQRYLVGVTSCQLETYNSGDYNCHVEDELTVQAKSIIEL